MKTFSTIFITGTIVSSIMMMGNKEEFNMSGFEKYKQTSEIIKDIDSVEDILELELEINYDQIFIIKDDLELSLNEIDYLEDEDTF